ncbi:MAG: hypothetical protein WBL31_17595, partial [Ilumatobacteraceae bacterium]
AFTTPAETRGLGGFMGNWIELTADDGRIRVSAAGPVSSEAARGVISVPEGGRTGASTSDSNEES